MGKDRFDEWMQSLDVEGRSVVVGLVELFFDAHIQGVDVLSPKVWEDLKANDPSVQAFQEWRVSLSDEEWMAIGDGLLKAVESNDQTTKNSPMYGEIVIKRHAGS